ncbi:hydantoinase B/oxoprolinase family protein, partial [Klebsiella pneumoniae]|uniref:hydantoinase B/oxoprolinase family protein n=1 Tax=Klebsiella pneumoniae TaxID=573 RepID=UPI001C717C1F
DGEPLAPFEVVRPLAVARITMPRAMVRVSAGREAMDDAMQALCFMAGANSMFYGDVLLTNDPWKGTGHLFDMTMVSPVFHDGALVALFASTLHVIDIGGIGSSADGLEVYHE